MANTLRKAERISDFNPSEFLATHEEHETRISDLTERTIKLEKNFATPQAAAAFIEDCAQDSRNFDNVFAKMFCRFLDENPDVREAVRKRMAEVDRNFFYKAFKRFWFLVYSAMLVVGTIVIKDVVRYLLSLIPHH